MNTAINWFITFYGNVISWLFSMKITNLVTVGSLMVVVGISALVISNLMIIARR